MEQKSILHSNKYKSIAPFLFIAGACIAIFAFCLDILLPPGMETKEPEFRFENVGPCLENSRDILERFQVGDQQYICADLKTSEPAVYLELHIFTNNKEKQIYVDGETFASGPISFYIYPPLPPGRYWAKITWARPALVDFEIEVVGTD